MEDENKYNSAYQSQPQAHTYEEEAISKLTGELGRKPTVLDKIALTLSGVFSPLIVPTYACAMALWITPLQAIPEHRRFVVSLIVFLITTGIPLATIIFMIRTGKVSDAAISDRRQRGIPYAITGLSFLLAAFYLALLHAPGWLPYFFSGACFCTLLATVINIKWKISAHLMTMGGLVAMLMYIAFHGLAVVPILPWISGAVILSGMVGSSRLLLGRHTPLQVYAGWLMGLVVVYLFMCI